MYVVLVAHDFAPSQGLSKLQHSLEQRGHTVTSFLGFGKEINAQEKTIDEHIRNANVLLAGMSSSRALAAEELQAARIALHLHIPFGFYSDTYGTWNRPWLRPLSAQANFLFVLNEQDATLARKSVKTGVRVVAAGNPLWEDFAHPTNGRTVTRKLLGLKESDTMLLVAGTKELSVNMSLFAHTIEAAKKAKRKTEIFISLHPGDKNNPHTYKTLMGNRASTHLVLSHAWSGSALVPGADLVICSASTIGIEAAHQRIPVINFFTKLSRKRLFEATGQTTWTPDELGASVMVYEDTAELTREIIWLLTQKGRQEMQEKQKIIFPVIKRKGEVVRIMAETLLSIAS